MVSTIMDDPVLNELTGTLREWHQIWISLYLDNQINQFELIGDLLIDLIDSREELISVLSQQIDNSVTQTDVPLQTITKNSNDINRTQQISELKSDIIIKLDYGNQLLGLDLTLRDVNFKPVDPVQLSPVKLYQLHAEVVDIDSTQTFNSIDRVFGQQSANQESSSATESNLYSTTSQCGSEITLASLNAGHHKYSQSSCHLQLAVKQHSITLLPHDEKFELYFSISETNANSAQLVPVSERFLIKVKKDVIIDGHSQTIFTNIGSLKGRELVLVVQAYRNGRMLLTEPSKASTFSKQQSSSNLNNIQDGGFLYSGNKLNSYGLPRSRHSTIGGMFTAQPEYKRPFGVTFVPLLNCASNKNLTKEFNINTKINLIQNESEFSQSIDCLYIANKKTQAKASSSQPSIQLDLSLRILICKQEIISRISSFVSNEYCLTEKRGFPDIVMPGDFKNDLYLNLESAEFEKGGKSIPKNVEASISLIDRSGLVIDYCILPASNCDKVSCYKSCIFYHTNSPRWNENLKINVPLNKFDQAHIRIEFRHCSTKDRDKKFIGFCFLPLSDEDGTVIPDKIHELYLYKCDSQLWEDDSMNLCKYSSLPYGPDVDNSSNDKSLINSGTGGTLRANNNQYNSNFTHSNREIVTVSTLLFSTKLTQNRTLLNLLKWRELIKRNNKDFEETLNKVLVLKGEEIVKFLQDILDTLFDTFTLYLSNENRYTALIFKVLVHIFLLLDEPKYHHFTPVLDTYASAHFSATLVYKGLLACISACVKKCMDCGNTDTCTTWQAPIQKCFKTLKYVFRFIVQSKILYSQATGDQSIDEHFLTDLRLLFKSFESMLASVDKRLLPLQETFLESFPGALEQLLRVMDPLELAKLVTSLAGSVGFHLPPPLARSKLIFMRIVASSPLLNCQEARLQISEIFCRHLEIYLYGSERLEMCHEVLELLLMKIHDSHWPTILKAYNQMTKKRNESIEFEQSDCTNFAMTVGEINLHSKQVSPIQANQLDLLLMEVSRELKPYVELMDPLLKLLDRLVRDLNSDRPIIQRYCTCLLTILKLMSKSSFDLFLSGRKFDYTNMCNLFKSLRAVYNRDWSIMQLTSHAILEHPIDEISSDDRIEINQNPSSYINLIVDFITHPTLQLESFSERKQHYILSVFGDLRLKFINQLMRFWNGLSKTNYYELISTSIQAFLDASLLPNNEVQSKLLLVFYDMIDADFAIKSNFRQIERCMIDNLDLHMNLDRGDAKFIENFDHNLKAEINRKQPVWAPKGTKLIVSFTKLMYLLVDYRNSLESYDIRSKQMICLVELLNFYKDLDRMDIYLKYLFKLCDIHLESHHFTEAGFTLKLYADELRWCNRNLSALEGFRPEEQEWCRKEILYQRIIHFFDLGKCWEESINMCKELASFYENFLVDYEKLSNILKRLTQLLDNILTEHRPEREYFRVEYLGSDLPDYIRGKEFIYRGGEYERLPSFIQRVTTEFHNAKVITSKGKKALAKDCPGQYLVISNVKPVPFLQDTFKTGQRIVNDKVIQYYLNNRLDTFSYDVPIVKNVSDSKQSSDCKQSSGTTGDQLNIRNLWVGRSMLKVRKQLPDILPWSDVVSQDYIEISPVTNAIETISSMNVELSKLILSYGKEPSKPLSPLTMRLQGVLEASVNGGPAVIMNAFFKNNNSNSHETSAPTIATPKQPDYESLMKLRNLIKQQFTLLETGLNLHSKLAPIEVMPLHERLVERLKILRRTFADEISQMFEENKYETLHHVNSPRKVNNLTSTDQLSSSDGQCNDALPGTTISPGPTTTTIATTTAAYCTSTSSCESNSRAVSSSVDELDGLTNSSSSNTCDLNGNICAQPGEQRQQATYSHPNDQQQPSLAQNLAKQTTHQHQQRDRMVSAFQSNGNEAKGELSSPLSSSSAAASSMCANHYSMSSNSSSLSTLAILGNLPSLTNGGASHHHQHHTHPHHHHQQHQQRRNYNRISLTPTKDLIRSSFERDNNNSSAAGKAARRLTFDSQRMSIELAKSATLRASTSTLQQQQQQSTMTRVPTQPSSTTIADNDDNMKNVTDEHQQSSSGNTKSEAPPLPPRIFYHDSGKQSIQHKHNQHVRNSTLAGMPIVPPRQLSPQKARQHSEQPPSSLATDTTATSAKLL